MTLKPANHKYRRTNGTSLTGENVYAEIELTNEDDLALNRHGYLPEHEIRRVTCRAFVGFRVIYPSSTFGRNAGGTMLLSNTP